jgi:hypothetical protein
VVSQKVRCASADDRRVSSARSLSELSRERKKPVLQVPHVGYCGTWRGFHFRATDLAQVYGRSTGAALFHNTP